MNNQAFALADSPFVDPDDLQQDEARQVSNSEGQVQPASTPPPLRLRPTLTGISSTVSSLSNSRGVSRAGMAQSTPVLIKNEARPKPEAMTHTLIQMLNMVGSRFMEAEGNGMLLLDEQEQQMGRQADESSQSLASVADKERSPLKLKRRLGGAFALEDEATPRGGRSPLASSLTNVHPTSRPHASQRWKASAQATTASSGSSESPFGSQELPVSQTAIVNTELMAPPETVASSTESSQSDVSGTGLQVSIHALSTAAETTLDRREQLADRLQGIFGLERGEAIVSCHPCWLFRGILLQGYVYVLTSHVCFYAYLPSREDRVLRAGTLRKRTKRTHRFSHHWAVLRGRALSWYESDKDPYFPQDHIDLRNVIGVDLAEDARFTVDTPYRAFVFESDSREGAQEWVSVLKKTVFRAQNEGESVRISIPLEAILDVDGSDTASIGAEWTREGQDMVSIKVINAAHSQLDFSMDEYFFLNLANQSTFIDELRERMAAYTGDQAPTRPKPVVRDSTSSPKVASVQAPDDTCITVASGLESQLAEAAAPPSADCLSTSQTLQSASLSSLSSSVHSYPPSHSSGHSVQWERERKSVLPGWVKEASSRLTQARRIRESWSAFPVQESEGTKVEAMDDSNSSLFSILEAPEREGELLEADAVRQFRECFSLPDSEKLLGHLSASLYRVLPVTGRLHISTHYICFRSSRLASKAMGRTLMILPKKEIISLAKNSAFRYGHHGLVLIVRGHEELFLEFASTQRREQCIALINLRQEQDKGSSLDGNDALLLTDLGKHLSTNEPGQSADLGVEDSPVTLFNSTSSIATKPRENLHITFLTIGSRGDVQPYIAFANGLKQEGHRVRIATHKEFQAWIESYDIEFKEVGGDPAELMRICVENGTFTMAFLRESMTKFRGWLDDLLISCWHACQGTDVVVESPSAIAGIHVAEALQVPYYRSFTMPWTRTRVYPHAFAVPGHKAGGNYNYLSYVIFDQVFWRASAGQINRWRRDCLGLKPTSLDRLEQHKVPFLYNFSPHLVPKPIDWYDWIHVTGFWFLEHASESGKWTPPEDLTRFIARARQNGRKLVYIGWGSIVVSDAEATAHTVMEAVKKSGVCAILSKGWSDRLQSDVNRAEDSHPNVFTVQSIPHDWLFPQLDAACHHGGSGTLGASLRAGIPTVVKPYFGDQFFWASQVESLHIGTFVRNFTIDSFTEALQVCTSDIKMMENAKRIGELIRAEDGVANAIRAFYSDWEYACSRIPKDGKLASASKGPPLVSPRMGVDLEEEEEEEDDDDDGLDGWSVVSESEEAAAEATG